MQMVPLKVKDSLVEVFCAHVLFNIVVAKFTLLSEISVNMILCGNVVIAMVEIA